MDNTEELRAVSFCAGYSGLELGLELAGVPIQPIAFSEIEAYPIANLLAKMEAGTLPPTPIWTDLKTFPMEEFRGCVDILLGGFPCQPFSTAGSRNGDEDPRHLFPYFKKFAKIVRPRYLFLENVDGIASAKLAGDGWADPKGTPVLLHVCRELERVGYRVAKGCFKAKEMGEPHRRMRWFILGELGHFEKLLSDGLEPGTTREPKECEPEPRNADREDVGNTEHLRLYGAEVTGRSGEDSHGWEEGAGNTLQSAGASRSSHLRDLFQMQWPAGPGQYQHHWEEPRTIPNPADFGCRGREDNSNGSNGRAISEPSENLKPVVRGEATGCSGNGQAQGCETESKLGGAANGASSGVDPIAHRMERLKLCGNGVVPQTAARAWITLIHTLRNNKQGYFPTYKEPNP